jgi:hypothetical protein
VIAAGISLHNAGIDGDPLVDALYNDRLSQCTVC